MLANARITRPNPTTVTFLRLLIFVTLVTFFLFITASNIPRVAAQSSLPPMPAADAPIIDYQNRYLPTYGKAGMVVSPEKLAGDIGLDMLKQGGNAVDAAVATGFALAVTLPRAGNIGGGGFMLIHLAETNEQIFIDYRETAPAAATRDMFLKEDGSVDQAKAYFSHQAAGVPGTVAGLIHAQERYGKLSLKEVIQPAIDLAKKGFDTPLALHMSLNARAERLAKNEEAKRIYLQGGDTAPAPSARLKRIAQLGCREHWLLASSSAPQQCSDCLHIAFIVDCVDLLASTTRRTRASAECGRLGNLPKPGSPLVQTGRPRSTDTCADHKCRATTFGHLYSIQVRVYTRVYCTVYSCTQVCTVVHRCVQ